MKPSSWSIKRYLMVIGVIGSVLLMTSWAIFGVYSIYEFRKTYAREYEVFTENLAESLAHDMESQETYVKNIYSNNAFYKILKGPDINENQWVRAAYYLDNAFYAKAENLEYSGGVFFYDYGKNSMRSEYSTDRYTRKEYALNTELKKHLVKLGDETVNSSFILEFENEEYYVFVFGDHGKNLGYVINLSRYATPWEDMQIVIFDDNHTIIVDNGSPILNEKKLQKRVERGNFNSGVSYIFQHKEMPQQGLHLFVIKYDSALMFWHRVEFWLVIVLVPLIYAMLLRQIYRFVRQIIYQPINHVVERLTQMKSGDYVSEGLSVGAKEVNDSSERRHSDPEEIRIVNERLDELLAEMQALEQAKFEKEKEADAALLQYYQLQVRPHFYLNCLNLMAALLDGNDVGLVKKMVYAVSKHFRYVFQRFDSLVTLEEEINEVRNYVGIYEIQHSSPILLQISMDDDLKKRQVPILCIQTFVENSIKYAVKTKQVLSLNVKVNTIEDEDGLYIRIQISDNGDGYPEELFDQLNSPVTEFRYKSRNVGVDNLKYRIYLLYRERARMYFYNSPTGGAVTEILLPMGNYECTDYR